MGKTLRLILGLLVLVLLAGAIGFVVWAETPAQPLPEALPALQSDDRILVNDESWLVFSPIGSEPTTGFIFYPGGRVDARSYAPAARQIAEQGYFVVIVPMPLNLAVFGAARAAEVIEAYPQVERWAIGGHSLGGAMAANFAVNHPGAVTGLVLWAAYPASSDDLSKSGLQVASIYGTLDGLSTGEKIDASRPLLPADTSWVPILGGNHAQFGWYGDQAGDNSAAISRLEQQEQLVAATLELLESIK
ncbi:MAG: alpha/beta hydrolase [Anaerolineales bacterium]|jgi:hypothetical protein|nr:alpha/beta hydrolase [Anaerolineales bacterium]